MEGAEFDELVADIKRRGLRVPITTFREPITREDGSVSVHEMRTVIIDGRNRARACAEAGITPRYQEFDGDADDVARFIISMNILRRHLKPEQRRDKLVKLLKLHPEKSNRAISADTGIPLETVRRARKTTDPFGSVAKRVGRDGKTRRMPTPKAKPDREQPTKTEIAAAASQTIDIGPPLPLDVPISASVGTAKRNTASEPEEPEPTTAAAQIDPKIDPKMLPKTAQEKLAAAIRQHRRNLDAEYDQRRSKEIREHIQRIMPTLQQERNEAFQTEQTYREFMRKQKKIMTVADFTFVLSCLHPDSRSAVTEERLRRAFQLLQPKKFAITGEK